MRRWWRIDPLGARQVLSGFMLAVASTMAVVVLVSLAAGRFDVRDAFGLAGLVAFLALWMTLVARYFLVGVYVNDSGLRLRYTFSTRTLPWSRVTGFVVRPAELLGEPTARDACWVRTADGAVETPVQRRSRTVGWRKDIGPVLRTEDFGRMVARLDAELAAARRGQAGGGVVLR
ncbi:hypothetical protein [Micromonospora sp. NPDC023633]|uniref:PH domain-containing protein n=1 Tax=Micromonospora sp. NPDC023633 TaxID=3154320 RepID=UPI0033DDFEBD